MVFLTFSWEKETIIWCLLLASRELSTTGVQRSSQFLRPGLDGWTRSVRRFCPIQTGGFPLTVIQMKNWLGETRKVGRWKLSTSECKSWELISGFFWYPQSCCCSCSVLEFPRASLDCCYRVHLFEFWLWGFYSCNSKREGKEEKDDLRFIAPVHRCAVAEHECIVFAWANTTCGFNCMCL